MPLFLHVTQGALARMGRGEAMSPVAQKVPPSPVCPGSAPASTWLTLDMGAQRTTRAQGATCWPRLR